MPRKRSETGSKKSSARKKEARKTIKNFEKDGLENLSKKQLRKLVQLSKKNPKLLDSIVGKKTPEEKIPDHQLIKVEIINVDQDNATLNALTLDRDPYTLDLICDEKVLSQLSIGDHCVVKLVKTKEADTRETVIKGRFIRKIEIQKNTLVGLVEIEKNQTWISSLDKRRPDSYPLTPDNTHKLSQHTLVTFTFHHIGNKTFAKILTVVGEINTPASLNQIIIHTHNIRSEFPEKVLKKALQAKEPTLENREDLRHIPLVTIDGEDAKDFDDAVWAEPDTAPDNTGGWNMLVAIADVSYYVQPHDDLDMEAFRRGNSVYLPHFVSPMLPEKLSNDLCSLKPNVDRACLSVFMTIDRFGKLKTFRFTRGLMRSKARLTYTQAQNIFEKKEESDLLAQVKNLFGAYDVLKKAREKRGTLNIELPEYKVQLDDKGYIKDVIVREVLSSHQLIEEFMVLANVAAAQALEQKRAFCVYRVHETPDPQKIENLRQYLKQIDINLAKGQVIRPNSFNQIVKQVKDTPHRDMVNEMILRSQSQARYSPVNAGHFGLNLTKYAHFTSPIRRYSDLIVHRSLIKAYELGEGGLDPHLTLDDLHAICMHISETERKASAAERDAMDRFLCISYLDQVGKTFQGRISGINNAGLFVTLPHHGATGLLPMRSLGHDFYDVDDRNQNVYGRRTKQSYSIGEHINVSIASVDALLGTIRLNLADKKPIIKKNTSQQSSSHNKKQKTNDKRKKRRMGKKESKAILDD